MARKRIKNSKKAKRIFANNANRTHRRNISPDVSRGGIRL